MPKYKVSLLSPMLTWDEVDAESLDKALEQCWNDPSLDRINLSDGPFHMHGEEIEEDEVEEEEIEEDADREMIGNDIDFGLGPIGNK
ncbi:hypothetical protein KA005_30450 [bacterium]|nr:hypothetical protein [bacterium]